MYDVETKFKVNHICLLFAFIFSIMPIIAKRLQWCQVFFFIFNDLSNDASAYAKLDDF